MDKPRWICTVTYLRGGKFPDKSRVVTIDASSAELAAKGAIKATRPVLPSGRKQKIDEVTIKIKRAEVVKEAE